MTDPSLITQAQAGAALDAQHKLAQLINLVELLSQWSALASVDQVGLESRAQASGKSTDSWRAGAAAGRAVAYNRAAQQLQLILGIKLPAAEPPSF